jgi:hypothetical protein
MRSYRLPALQVCLALGQDTDTEHLLPAIDWKEAFLNRLPNPFANFSANEPHSRKTRSTNDTQQSDGYI